MQSYQEFYWYTLNISQCLHLLFAGKYIVHSIETGDAIKNNGTCCTPPPATAITEFLGKILFICKGFSNRVQKKFIISMESL